MECMYEKKNLKNTHFWNALTLFEIPIVLKCLNFLDPRGLFLQCFGPILRATKFLLYLRNAEVLSHQTSQSSWFFLH